MSFYREYFSKPVVWYVYPLWHKVSFTLVGQKHVEQLKKYYRLYEVDELSFLPRDIFVNPIVLIHPYFYIITRYTQLFFNYYDKFKAVIGIEVADSDRLSPYAIRLANMTHAIVVPSNFSKEAFINSGCKVPVYVVPHGISKLFFRPRRYPQHPLIRKLYELKQRDNLIYILFFLIHSGYRKGAHLVYVVLKEIQKTWKNVVLICKAGGFGGHDVQLLATLRSHIIVQWFSENDLVDLYDICDIYTLFSIGGGFECVPPDTNIICYDGVKPISEVKEGDLVLTHKGRFRRVTKVFKRKYKGKIIEIIPYGFSNISIKLTPEHPVLAIVRKGRVSKSINSDLMWIRAKELKKGDFVVFPILLAEEREIVYDLAKFVDDKHLVVEDEWLYYSHTGSPRFTEVSYKDIERISKESKKIVCTAVKVYKGEINSISDSVKNVVRLLNELNYEPQYVKIKRFVKFDENLAKVIGYYLAEGSISSDGRAVEFSFGEEPELVEDLVNAIIHAFNYIPSVKQYRNGKVIKVIISSKVIAKFLETLCGKGAHNKRLPPDCYKLDLNTTSWLVWSMILGDGHVKGNKIRYVTTSKNLAFGIYTLLIKLGYKPRIEYRVLKPRGSFPESKQWEVGITLPYKVNGKKPNENPLTPRRCDYIMHSNKRYLDFNRGYMISIIREVREVDYDGYVYNLEVEEDNSYVANLVTVHNCNGLEALSRGLVVLACEKGSWTDYLPDFLLIPYSTKVQVFPDANPVTSIHCGYGYQISIPHAIDKLHDVLNNLDDYKARVREYWQKVAHNWTWETVGLKLKNIIDKFVS